MLVDERKELKIDALLQEIVTSQKDLKRSSSKDSLNPEEEK